LLNSPATEAVVPPPVQTNRAPPALAILGAAGWDETAASPGGAPLR
jgi:hypothetical protein